MVKNIQTKIILIFFIIGIVIILGIGFFINNIIVQSKLSYINNTSDITQIFETEQSQTKILILVAILVFSCIIVVVRIICDRSNHKTNK